MFMVPTLRDWWLMQWSTLPNWTQLQNVTRIMEHPTDGKFRECSFVKIKNLHRCVGWFDVQLRIQSPIQAADCAGAILSLIFSTGVQAVTVFYNLFGLVLNVFTEAGAKPVEQFNSFVVSSGPRIKAETSGITFFLQLSQIPPVHLVTGSSASAIKSTWAEDTSSPVKSSLRAIACSSTL